MDDPTLQLLQKIADNTGQSDSMTIAIVAGASGVLGAGLTAWCGYLIAKKTQVTEEKRLRAGIVTTERLRWLQDVRQRLARFYVQLDMQFNFLQRPIPPTLEGKIEYQKQIDVLFNEINEQSNIISMMMNPEKAEQKDLRSALQESLIFVNNCVKKQGAAIRGNAGLVIPLSPDEVPFDNLAYAKIKTKAFDSLTRIVIKTWKRIKDDLQ
jgi:hypothetical protein